MNRAAAVAIASLLVLWPSVGCKNLPNPETDEVSRLLRRFDRLQRPSGRDLPIERYLAWTARRDAGTDAPEDLTKQLAALVEDQRWLVGEIGRMETHSKGGTTILEAYLGAHRKGHEALEEVLAARTLGDPAMAEQAAAAVQAAYEELRGARQLRAAIADRLHVVDRRRGTGATK